MDSLNIVYYPDDPLTLKAAPFDVIGPEMPTLAQAMLRTMERNEGVGLAGPQVGIARRIFVLRDPDGEPMCLVNPQILEREGSELGDEGCLSLPGLYAKVPRATRIQVRTFDEFGEEREFEARDFLARVIQHEYDHLDGIIFPDRLDILSREDLLRQWNEIREEMFAEQRVVE